MKNTFIEEPKLYFGNNEENIDPKIGLINFGCYGRFSKGEQEPLTIRAGFIGTLKAKQMFEVWLEKLRYRISGRIDASTNKREVDFPGISLESPLKFEIKVDDSCCQYIDDSTIKELEKYDRKERVAKREEDSVRINPPSIKIVLGGFSYKNYAFVRIKTRLVDD